MPLDPRSGLDAANLEGFLGVTGVAVPINGRVVDAWSLAYPLTAHLHMTARLWPGHEKFADATWTFADYAAPGTVPPGVDPRREAAARHVLTCGRVRELQESVRAPMTWHRFWANVFGAPERTALRIPVDPLIAEKRFCGR